MLMDVVMEYHRLKQEEGEQKMEYQWNINGIVNGILMELLMEYSIHNINGLSCFWWNANGLWI